MPAAPTLLSLLAEGKYSLSTGQVPEVVALVLANPKQAGRLVELLWHEHPGVAARAADVLERISHHAPPALQRVLNPFVPALIGLLAESQLNKTRWNLALTLPRLALSPQEVQLLADILQESLADRSSIVKTAAMQGLADLTRHVPARLPATIELLRQLSRSGTAAMRARGRILLSQLERAQGVRADDSP